MSQRVTWRFPILILSILGAFLTWLWWMSNWTRQFQFMLSYAGLLLALLVLLPWFFFFSKLSGRLRVYSLLGMVLVTTLFALTIRIRGLSGDWVPVVEWRWSGGQELVTEASGATDLGAGDIDLAAPRAFPGFLGADRDSIVRRLELASDWEARPPRLVWKQPIGEGWAGFAIAGELAFTLEQRGDEEWVTAYRLETGEMVWKHADVAYFSNPMAGPGPRTTPSVSQEAVFTVGGTGVLNALERQTGKLLWKKDLTAEHGSQVPEFGKSNSPLLVDDLVVVSAGGPQDQSLVAYRQSDGELAWTAGRDRSSYSSPIVTMLAGIRQIVVLNGSSVAGHAVEDGRVLWQHDYPGEAPNVAPPLPLGDDQVIFSTGYGVGSSLFRIAGEPGALEASLVWESPRMKAKFTNLVLYEGDVYGLDDGVLVCLDPATGERRWKAGRYGHGSLLLVGNVLLLQTEKGEMVLIEANPEEHRELGRFLALEGKAWNHFALVDPYLLVRNDREAALWELPVD